MTTALNHPQAAVANSGRDIAYRKPFVNDGTLRFGIFWPFSRSDFPSRLLEERNPAILDIDNHIRLAKAVETVGLDMILVPDVYASAARPEAGDGYLDPSTHGIVTATSLIWATRRIGIVSTIHTTFFHPVQIARFGGHLSHLSGGRWGWNIVVGRAATDARLFGFKEIIEHDARYDLAAECVELVKRIWESPGAVSHAGRQFSVEGTLRGPRPLGRPMLVSASASDRGHAFAVDHCDYLFANAASADVARGLRREMHERSERNGKATPPMLIIGAILVRDRRGEAEGVVREIIDAFEAEGETGVNQDRAAKTRGMLTDYPGLIGTAEEVADRLIALHETGVTGVMLRLPYWTPEEALRIRPVFDRLAKAGVWVPPLERQYSW